MNLRSPGRRAVLTGLGVVAANGCELGSFWASVRDGVSAARPVTRFDVREFPSKIAAEVQDFDGSRFIGSKKAKHVDRSNQYAIAAATQAVSDAGLDLTALDPERVGVVEATSLCAMESAFRGQTHYLERGYRHLSPFFLANAYFGSGSGEIALHLGVKGHAVTQSSGSASGSDVLGYALDMIRQDQADLMVAGGAEAPLFAPLWGGFSVAKLLTSRNEDPPRSMRPFDRARDGFLIGEGAGFLVVEELSRALARGARIYAELVGHGRSCEAYHAVAPQPDGGGVARAIERALRAARVDPSEVQYINAHGTATESNDVAEARAIKRVFGPHTRQVAVSSTKPVTGHLLAAAGAVEAVVCALAIRHQTIPPTINLTDPAAECDLDYVTDGPRPYPLRVGLSLSSGFGGKNSCLVFRDWRAAA
jgi:3-oxoacyl-[acyl-carrier-protein] synthase II